MRQILFRMAGVGLIGLGWGAALLLRAESRAQAPSVTEFLLVLATFVLTLAGAVLVFNGTRPWGTRRQRTEDRSSVAEPDEGYASIARCGTEREILGRLLARRTIGGK